MKRGFGFSRFPRVGRQGLRVERRLNAHLNKKLMCVGKRNLPHEMGLSRWELAGTGEGSK